MPKYKGKDVKSKPVAEGDPGYDPNKEQVIITNPDGSTETVPANQVTQ